MKKIHSPQKIQKKSKIIIVTRSLSEREFMTIGVRIFPSNVGLFGNPCADFPLFRNKNTKVCAVLLKKKKSNRDMFCFPFTSPLAGAWPDSHGKGWHAGRCDNGGVAMLFPLKNVPPRYNTQHWSHTRSALLNSVKFISTTTSLCRSCGETVLDQNRVTKIQSY